MLRQFRTFDAILAALLLFTLGIIGYFVYSANPKAHRSYGVALLEFEMSDRQLTEDLYRLQAGELSHYDGLVADVRSLRQAEHQLSRLPAHVEDFTELNDLVTQLAALVNQKLDRVEDFKSALAALRVGMDNLPALANEVRRSPEGSQISKAFLSDMLNNMLVLIDDPAAHHLDVVLAQLDLIAKRVEGITEADGTTPLQHFAQRTAAVVHYEQQATGHLRDITALPLSGTIAQLSYAYHNAHQKSRIRAVAFVSTVLAAMIVFFVVLTYFTRWRTAQREAAIEEKQRSLARALREARAQTATLKKGEVADATILAEERLATLLNNTFDMVCIISREENFIFISPAVTPMLGLSREELIGRSVYEGIHDDDLIRVKDYFTRAQKELQTTQTVSYRLMDAHGKWHVVETFASN
ncbi:MAG: PAS domain S-box protein, partial [Candidatus Hydrogenedentes bacterium]|nr:PAS domain S-box protein [Candidatus Hydrogenedentota bacterium]